jgi:fibronectin-binding autotransporter adhesin
LRSGGAAARTALNNSVGLLSSVGRIAYLRGGSGSVGSSSNWSHKSYNATTAPADSAKVASSSSSSSSKINDDLLGLRGTHHTVDVLAGLGHASSNHSGGSNRTGTGGIGGGSGTASGGSSGSHGSGSHGSGGGGATATNKANTGAKTVSAANTHPGTTTGSSRGTTGIHGGTTVSTGGTTGTGSLTHAGTGTTTLTGNNTYTGPTTVNAGTLLIDGDQSVATGAVTVNNSGSTLGGTGTIGGTVTVNSGANLAPGNSPGILNTGSVTLASNSNFRVDINGSTVGTQYDQLNVTGTVDISGSNLVVTVGGALTIGDTYTIVNNDLTDAVVGQFAQGTSVQSGVYNFSINYAGGTGSNDGVLTLAAAPEPSTWVAGALAFAAVAFSQRRRFARLLKRPA